jgi:hypothetical protein
LYEPPSPSPGAVCAIKLKHPPCPTIRAGGVLHRRVFLDGGFRQPIIDTSEIYSGVYARVSLSFYAFNSNGNKGIACGLQNIQKVRDGESLGGRTKAEDDFNDGYQSDADDDFLG